MPTFWNSWDRGIRGMIGGLILFKSMMRRVQSAMSTIKMWGPGATVNEGIRTPMFLRMSQDKRERIQPSLDGM